MGAVEEILQVRTERKPTSIEKFVITINFFEPALGSSPCDPEVYRNFLQERKRKQMESAGKTPEQIGDELKDLPEMEEKGWTVYHRDANGCFVFDYHIKGFLKEAAEAVTGRGNLTMYKSKIDKWIFVFPRKLYFERNGKPILKPDGVLERPLRAMTMQGPRVTVARSDMIELPACLTFEIHVLPLGVAEFKRSREEKKLGGIEDYLNEWFAYGEYMGFSQWRTGSYGRFKFELKKK